MSGGILITHDDVATIRRNAIWLMLSTFCTGGNAVFIVIGSTPWLGLLGAASGLLCMLITCRKIAAVLNPANTITWV